MRTTLNIDDDLYRRAKSQAAQRGCSVTSVIEDALRTALLDPAPDQAIPDLPIARETGGPMPGIDLHDARALAAVLDEGRPIHAVP